MNAPLLFQRCPDAVYGFPHARLVERVEPRCRRIEIWNTRWLGALFTVDGRPMTSAETSSSITKAWCIRPGSRIRLRRPRWCSAICAPRSHRCALGTFVPRYGSPSMMTIASDTLDPAALTAGQFAGRLATRGIDSPRHDEPALRARLFSAARSVRDKLDPLTKSSI